MTSGVLVRLHGALLVGLPALDAERVPAHVQERANDRAMATAWLQDGAKVHAARQQAGHDGPRCPIRGAVVIQGLASGAAVGGRHDVGATYVATTPARVVTTYRHGR